MNNFIDETLPEVDEFAAHHTIDKIHIGGLEITALMETAVESEATGTIGVEQQWGPRSDIARDDDATHRMRFPFEITMHLSVDNITSFKEVAHWIDTRRWYAVD